MNKKIFQSILKVTIIVLLSSLLLVTGVLHNYFQKIQVKQLKDELSLASLGTEQEGLNYLSNLNTESYRITWIASEISEKDEISYFTPEISPALSKSRCISSFVPP